MSVNNESLFDPKNEVKAAAIKWTKIGDWFSGTLTNISTVEVKDLKNGDLIKKQVWEFKIDSGEFHVLDENEMISEPGITLVRGDSWVVWGNPKLEVKMRNAKLGQIIGMKFTASEPSATKGFKNKKIISVYPGQMDPEYVGPAVAEVAKEEEPAF